MSVSLFLCLIIASVIQSSTAFGLIQSTSTRSYNLSRSCCASASVHHHHLATRPTTQLSISTADSDTTDILTIEEITTFATNNGITLSFKTAGPGYRGVATTKDDQENILGYIEGFIRPGGKILHGDKMEIFKSALNEARREGFKGGGTFLGPGLLIAFVCLLHGKESGCENVEFLAIDDAEFQHKRLVRYYKTAGFEEVRYVGEELKDIPDRLVWGGCGTLMTEKIDKVLLKWTRIIRGAEGGKM